MSTTIVTTKVNENRLRRMAERQGLTLEKCRRRDPLAIDYGSYVLRDADGCIAYSKLPNGGWLDQQWITAILTERPQTVFNWLFGGGHTPDAAMQPSVSYTAYDEFAEQVTAVVAMFGEAGTETPDPDGPSLREVARLMPVVWTMYQERKRA